MSQEEANVLNAYLSLKETSSDLACASLVLPRRLEDLRTKINAARDTIDAVVSELAAEAVGSEEGARLEEESPGATEEWECA